MNIVGNSDQFVPLFPDDFLQDIVGRVSAAWQRVAKPVHEVLETRITKLLRHQYAYDPVIKRLPFQVRRELPIDDPMTGEELGRIDLCLLHGNEEDAYFAFEYKRLNVTFPGGRFESLASDYTGNKGMGCFVLQKYAAGHRHGGMIGYVFDGKIAGAKVAIETRLTKDAARLALQSGNILTCSLHPANSNIGETQHSISSGLLTLYHVFLSMK